ncbi:MAG: hypothetical protein M3389_09980 [Actinomycetota bacterium]|nr:hypothetical protein [Actinomycetota bacterium]
MTTTALTVALAACGDPVKGEVEDVVDEYLAALVEGDGPAACRHLSPRQRQALAQTARATSCETGAEAVGGRLSGGLRNAVNEAEITVELDGDDRATADIGGSVVITLEKTGGRWLITQGVSIEAP